MLDVAERLAALNDAILKGKIEGADAIRRVETLRMELILLHLLTAYKLHEIANLMKIVEAMWENVINNIFLTRLDPARCSSELTQGG